MERYTSIADKLAAVDKDTVLSSLLVNQLTKRVTFERVMEVLG